LPGEFGVGQRGTPHMHDRRLPADDLRHHAGDQSGIVAQFLILGRVLAQRPQPTAHRIARGVVAADDQQHEVAEELGRIVDQVLRRLAMRQHRDQV